MYNLSEPYLFKGWEFDCKKSTEQIAQARRNFAATNIFEKVVRLSAFATKTKEQEVMMI